MRNFRQYDVEFLVKVKQLYRGHFSGRAAWICRSAKLNYMRVSIALHEGNFTLASTIIGIVFLRCNHPIPAETLEIHRQRMATTALLVTLLRALQTAPLCSLLSLIFRQNVDVRTLWTKISILIYHNLQNCMRMCSVRNRLIYYQYRQQLSIFILARFNQLIVTMLLKAHWANNESN